MNKLEKYLYHTGIKKLTFDKLEIWHQQKEVESLVWALSLNDLLIQEKAFKLLASNPSESTVFSLCDYASTCNWQLNHVVFSTLLSLLEETNFSQIKRQKSMLIEQMTSILASEKIERTKAANEGRELPSDRLKKIQKDHRHFIGKGLSQLRKK